MATTSTCKLGGRKQDVGNKAVLSENGSCGYRMHTGCYIKKSILTFIISIEYRRIDIKI